MATRKQRLRTLENRIRKNYESFVQTGTDLIEIRDDHLYEEDDFETWDQYLKERVGEVFGIESAQVYRLMTCATIRPKLPDLGDSSASESTWSQRAVYEFRRLAPKDDNNPRYYDLRKLKKGDCKRVYDKVIEVCEETDSPITSTIVRRCVDEDIGPSEPTPNKPPGIDLPVYLRQKIGTIEGVIENLALVPADGWKLLTESEPGLAERLAEVCDELAALLRS